MAAVVVEGRVVNVLVEHRAAAVAAEGRRFVVGCSRWLDSEAVESRSEAGHTAVIVVVVAADHSTQVSFAYS